MKSPVHRNLVVAAILVVLIVIYGSLYPFELRPGGGNPVLFLLGTWRQPPSSRGDLIANILLYMPYGFFAALAAAPWRSSRKKLIWVTAGGFVLCVAMELAQFYFVDRVTNMSDVYLNTFGSFLGAVGGVLLGSDFRWPFLRELTEKPFPALLLAAWYGYRLYPYVPTIDLHKYWHAIRPLFALSEFALLDLYRFTVIWLVLAYLIETIFGARLVRFLFLAFAAVEFLGKIFILGNVLKLAEILGVLLAYLAWGMFARTPRRAGILAVMMMVLLILFRLEPFHLSATPHPFGWIPFLGFMHGSLEIDIQSFLEKFFLYGSAIWILIEAGMSLGRATVLVAGTLFVTSMIETYLPRSAELTDATLAVAIAIIYRLVPDRVSGPAPRFAANARREKPARLSFDRARSPRATGR
ncbi:MAG TPA: VanZ family protein [Alphaproteobacteria bacterium]|nr:VanZ family protein [Alphaproteobacteria bacterium]